MILIRVCTRNGDIFMGGNSVKIVFVPFLKKWSTFSEGASCPGKQTGSRKNCLPCKKKALNPSSVSSSVNT